MVAKLDSRWFELQEAITNNPKDGHRVMGHALTRVRDKKKERLIHSLHYFTYATGKWPNGRYVWPNVIMTSI